MLHVTAPTPRVGYRRATRTTALVSAAALLTAAGCGNPAANQNAAAQSTNGSPTGIAALIPNLFSSATLQQIIALLKNSGLVNALKEAWANGTCKAEVTGVAEAGRGLLVQLVGKVPALITGSKLNLDLSNAKDSLNALATCFESAAPKLLQQITASLASSSGASKLAEPDAFLVKPEDVSALDPNNWLAEPTTGGEAAATAPAGDTGVGASPAAQPSDVAAPAVEAPASPASSSPEPEPAPAPAD